MSDNRRNYLSYMWYLLGSTWSKSWTYLTGSHGSLRDNMAKCVSDKDAIVTVDPETDKPTKLWFDIGKKEIVKKVKPESLLSKSRDDHIRFVCVSDTHARMEVRYLDNKEKFIPDGDVLIHAGDITDIGLPYQVDTFNQCLGNMPHRVKIVIAGNHDLTFDDHLVNIKRSYLKNYFGVMKSQFEDYLEKKGVNSVKDLLTNCVYLEDSSVEIYGIRIYGSPWQPWFGGWGFNLRRGEKCLQKWNAIPNETDILITHGPPLGHGDKCFDQQRAGCVELLRTIQKRVKPKFHIFGHIHEGYGITTDDCTTYINASTCTLRYRPDNPPIVFDYPIPPGHSKDEILDLCVKQLPEDGTLNEREVIPRHAPIAKEILWESK